MHGLLSRPWDKRARLDQGEKGFTLIELLVVVVILGVLIAIAIPLYLNYRKGANDAAAQSDLKNAISVMELCNADNGKYPATAGATGTIGPGPSSTAIADKNSPACARVINLSSGTTLIYTFTSATASYMITDSNGSGTPKYYCYNSVSGGAVKTTAAYAVC